MSVRPEHPRIFLTPGILATLRARAVRGTQRWLGLQSLVDRPGATWDVGLGNYALVYQVTGDLTAAQKALTLMQESMAAGLAQVTPDSGYPCRSFFPGSAMVFDWCYSAMTAAERQAMVASIEECAAWVWPETNPARAGAWAIDNPGSNYYYGFLTTWLAGLALSGDSASAPGILDLALSKWNKEVMPYLLGPARGGCMYEGTSYSVDSLSLMLMNLWAHLTATGETLAPAWTEAALTMLAHLTLPTMDALVPYGDQTKSQTGALQDAGRLPFLLGAAAGQPWAKNWLDNAVPNRMQQRTNAWAEFLYYPEEMVAQDYRQTWPGFAAAKGAGVVVSRSSWQNDAVFCTLSAGPTLESHQDRAAGAFGIAAGGEWLVGWAKTSSHSGIAQETNDSNCVTIGGSRQAWTQDQAQIVAQEDGPLYSYVRADLTGAYAGQCSRYVREYVFLKPGTFLVRDVLTGVISGVRVVFSVHAGRLRPAADALGYQVRGQRAALFVAGAIPANPAFNVVPLTNDRDPGVIGYRLDLGDQSGRKFLVVFEVAPVSQTGGTWHDWEVAGLAGAVSPAGLVVWAKTPAPWTYFAPGAVRHLILGAEPGKAYTVPGGTAIASAGGVLMFDGPPAGTKITVQVADDSGGGGGGGSLTNRTYQVIQGSLITDTGQKITLTGGQLVLQAIPGDASGDSHSAPRGASSPGRSGRSRSPERRRASDDQG